MSQKYKDAQDIDDAGFLYQAKAARLFQISIPELQMIRETTNLPEAACHRERERHCSRYDEI